MSKPLDADEVERPRFAEVRHWFFQKLDSGQRVDFLSIWLPMERMPVVRMSLHAQLEALRQIHERPALSSRPPVDADEVERVKRVDVEYWASFRENRAPVVGPCDLRAVLDVAISALEAPTEGGVSLPFAVADNTPIAAKIKITRKAPTNKGGGE